MPSSTSGERSKVANTTSSCRPAASIASRAGAAPALLAIEAAGLQEEVVLATFDLSPEVLEGIQEGTVLFAIDQQQYLQGYLPIVLLSLYQRNGNTIANDVLRTGPGFVDASNVDQVIDLTEEGTR